MSTTRIEPCPCGLKLIHENDGVGTRGFCGLHAMFLRKQSDGSVIAQREAFPRDAYNDADWRRPGRHARTATAPRA
jgi:hypothetical protein